MHANGTRAVSAPRLHFRPEKTYRPETAENIASALDPSTHTPKPIRPMGLNSAGTNCAAAEGGTLLDMTGMNKILQIGRTSVTVQAGVTLHVLAQALAAEGLELAASYDFSDRTVGGAISSGCFGPGTEPGVGMLASQVLQLKLISPRGAPIVVSATHPMMAAYRMSYGMLGVIYEITLKVRPIRAFTAYYTKMRISKFADMAPRLANSDAGLKFYMLPFRDRVYVELRRNDDDTLQSPRKGPWKLKEWIENAALPWVARSVAKVPIRQMRYSLIDGFNEATHALMNNKLTHAGNNSIEQSGRVRALNDWGSFSHCTWVFPAANFGHVLSEYRAFCKEFYAVHRFRCDMPAVGVRLNQDTSAMLSPCFDTSAFALSVLSTPERQWGDYLIDLSEFAAEHGGRPMFNHSRGATPEQVQAAFADRLDFFREIRYRTDPDDRMINPFLMQYFQ